MAMRFISLLSNGVKGKVVVATLVGTVLVGGTGVTLVATPMGHALTQQVVGIHTTTTTSGSDQKEAHHGTATATAGGQTSDQKGHNHACAGLDEAQHVATQFALSTKSNANAVLVICALHDGSFKQTINGHTVKIEHALGYGEITQVLTYAQTLAVKQGTKLTDSNVQMYVATALQTCGSTPIVPCIHGQTTSGLSTNGKPDSIPTPHVNALPTPHVNGKPLSIPTPPVKK
jgi:hypothetical protein